MFKKLKLSRAIDRLQEEKLYEVVAAELAAEEINVGIWTKAQAFSDGCERKAKSLYLQYRVQSIVDAGRILEEIAQHDIKVNQNRGCLDTELEPDMGSNKPRADENLEFEKWMDDFDKRYEQNVNVR